MISKVIWTCVYACVKAGGHRTYVYAYSKAGGDSIVIWVCVYACFSAGAHTDLRLCMFERRRRYGLTFLHIAAPAVIWTYVSAYASVVGDLENADVAVARVSCTLRLLCGGRGGAWRGPALESCAHFAPR